MTSKSFCAESRYRNMKPKNAIYLWFDKEPLELEAMRQDAHSTR